MRRHGVEWNKVDTKCNVGEIFYCRKDGKDRVYIYRFNKLDGDGNKVDTFRTKDKLNRPFYTLKAAKEDCAEFSVEVANRRASSASITGHTIELLWADYMKHRKDSLSPNSMAKHEGIVRNHLIPYFKKKNIEAITPSEVKNFLITKRSEFEYQTVRSIRATMSKIWMYAKEYHIITREAYLEIFDESTATMLKKERKHPDAMTHEQIEQVMEYAKTQGTPYYTMICLTFYGGVRIGEALGLMWQDIDWVNGKITIKQQLCYDKEGTYTEYSRNYISEPKERKVRVFDAHPQLMKALEDLKLEQAENREHYGRNYNDNEIVYDLNNHKPVKGLNFILRREDGRIITQSEATHFRERAEKDLGQHRTKRWCRPE